MTEDDNKVVTMKVRVTPEFREKLVTTAKENNRSMNAEIVDRLEKSFEPRSVIHAEDPESLKSIVTYSIKTVLDELRSEGVEDEKISKALHNVAKK